MIGSIGAPGCYPLVQPAPRRAPSPPVRVRQAPRSPIARLAPRPAPAYLLSGPWADAEHAGRGGRSGQRAVISICDSQGAGAE